MSTLYVFFVFGHPRLLEHQAFLFKCLSTMCCFLQPSKCMQSETENVCVCACVWEYVCICVCASVCVCLSVYVQMCVSKCGCVFVCLCTLERGMLLLIVFTETLLDTAIIADVWIAGWSSGWLLWWGKQVSKQLYIKQFAYMGVLGKATQGPGGTNHSENYPEARF